MRFQQLKYFTVLAEELHFGRAAIKLAISQPPLSTAIKSLEDELGVLLFQRDKRSVQLTPAGAAFLVEARKLLEGALRAKSVVKSVNNGMLGRLDVGFGGTLIFRDILQIVEQFNLEAPGIEVLLHEMQTSDQFEHLIRGQLNAGFTYGSAPPPKLKSIPLTEDSFVLCLPSGHSKAGESIINLSDLVDEAFVMFEREVNPVNHDNMISMFSRAGIYPRFIHYTRSWLTTVSMVSENCGMAIVPSSLSRMRMAGVCLVPLAGPRVPAHAMLTWNPALVAPALEKFLENAAQTIQKLNAASASQKVCRT